jgi:hypothetical protein
VSDEAWFPEGYGQETADTICEMLADGKSLRAMCREDGMPSTSTVCKWLARNAEFAEQYARARELQADALFDDCLALADNEHDKAATDANERRLQIDTRKWMAGKLKGKYSDKVKHVGGDEGDNPIAFTGFDVKFV